MDSATKELIERARALEPAEGSRLFWLIVDVERTDRDPGWLAEKRQALEKAVHELEKNRRDIGEMQTAGGRMVAKAALEEARSHWLRP